MRCEWETGLDYFGARYFSGAQGRFTSPDEWQGGPVDPFTGQQVQQPGPLPYADVRNPQSLNKYAYVMNNPLRYTDPDGHAPDELEDEIFVAGMTTLGGAIGMYVGGGAGGAGGGFVGAFAGGVGAIPGAAGGGALGAAAGGSAGAGLGYAIGKGIVMFANMLKDGDGKKQDQGQAEDRTGGGKTGRKQNLDKVESAKKEYEAAKKAYEDARSARVRPKGHQKVVDKLKRQADHFKRKMDEASEEHARVAQTH